MKSNHTIFTILSSCLFFLLVSCSDSDDESPLPNGDPVMSLNGTYEGLSFSASVSNGLVDGGLSGSLVLGSDGSYSSTISPFPLAEASGDWTYVEAEDWIVFNEGETSEEKAERLTFDGDTLKFTIYRGELTNQTVIDFVLLKK